MAIHDRNYERHILTVIQVNLLFAAMLTMMVGLVIAWKWEGIGGLLIPGGLAFFDQTS